MSGDLGFNKVAAAILATALGFMLIKEASHSAVHAVYPETPAYMPDIELDPTGNEAAEPLPFPQPEWVAAMDETRGVKVFKKCTSCHNAEDGGKNGTGPNIWDIVGKPAGKNAAFAYSGVLKTAGVTWGYEELDAFLKKPTDFMPGTKMNFIGLKKEADRAAVIEYLRVRSASPVAQPVPAAAPQEDEAETAELEMIEAEDDSQGMVEGAVEKTGNIAEDIQDGAKDIVDGGEKLIEDAAESAKDASEDVKDGAKDLMDKAKDAVGDE